MPHLVQDDGRLVNLYMRAVEHTPAAPTDFVSIAVDQSLHVVALFAIALVAAT